MKSYCTIADVCVCNCASYVAPHFIFSSEDPLFLHLPKFNIVRSNTSENKMHANKAVSVCFLLCPIDGVKHIKVIRTS